MLSFFYPCYFEDCNVRYNHLASKEEAALRPYIIVEMYTNASMHSDFHTLNIYHICF